MTVLKKYREKSTLITTRLEGLWHLVGNTPMVEICYSYKGRQRKIYAKCEHYNLTGSIKDRMALQILQQAYNEGSIHEGDRIVEATSGNTGIAFASIGRALGHPVTIIMPDWLSRERRDIIRSIGADIILVTKADGGFLGSIALAEKMKQEQPGIFLPRQFDNEYNAIAHAKTTAAEIWQQMSRIGKEPTAFVAGVGTGGTVMGALQFFKSKNNNIRVHPLEPRESPTLSTGHKTGSHRIQGISDEFIPAIVDLKALDPIIQASDGDSILMAQKLAWQLGLAVGISSGANLLGAIQLKEELGDDATVVTVFADSNKKYLSTDLVNEEPLKEGYLSPGIQLLDYTPIRRMA